MFGLGGLSTAGQLVILKATLWARCSRNNRDEIRLKNLKISFRFFVSLMSLSTVLSTVLFFLDCTTVNSLQDVMI